MSIEIKHRFTGETLFTSNTAIDLAGAVTEAVKGHANLSRANLIGADLIDANLSDADLSDANLSRANLSDANLSRANLSDANLIGANLSRANLIGADLSRANLSRANLSDADLSRANLIGADLIGANNADLVIAQTRILPDGDLIGFKKLANGVIAKIRIPEDAKRSHAFGRKCRAEYAIVIEGEGASHHDKNFQYTPGATVRANKWEPDWTRECAGGIHFFLTRIEAENY